jgi:hypothetical protein
MTREVAHEVTLAAAAARRSTFAAAARRSTFAAAARRSNIRP